MSAPSSEPSGAVSADPGPGSPPPGQREVARNPRPLSRRGITVLGAIVVAVVMVTALLLSGAVPGTHSSGSGTTPGPESENAAVSSAAAVLEGIPGGPWNLTLAAGMVTTFDYGQSSSSLFNLSPACPLRNSTVRTIDYPADNGTYYHGNATAWVLLYNSSTSDRSELILYAANGTAGEVGELSGSTTACGLEPYNPSLPAGLIGSPAAARSAADTSAGRAFISEFAHANASYELSFEKNYFGAIVNDIPIWYVFFSGCTGATMTDFQSQIFALNGTVESAQTTTTSC